MELPRSWKSTATEYDSNREYGLNLPRQVISNKFTQDLQIDGMDIFDVRLAQVMTGGLNNWGLRSLANGRHTVWESFKSRHITAGTLMRSMRGDNSAQSTGADLNATLTHMTQNMFPGQDPYLWGNRYNAIKELTKELAKVVVQKGPVAVNQSMLQQIQELQRENARLKSARPGAPSPAPSTAPRTVHTPPPKSNRAPKSTVTPKAAATPKSSGANPTPPSYRRPKDRQSTTETPDSTIRSLEDCWHSRRMDEAGSDQEQEPAQDEAKDDDATIVPSPDLSPTGVPDQDFADPLETVQTFERTDQVPFLDECKVDNYKLATINAWISHRVGKEKMPKVRTASDELLAAIGRLPPGNRPAIDAIAVGWGLPVAAAAKIGERSLCNLVATCYVLGQE